MAVILPTTAAKTRGLSGLEDPQVLLELYKQPPQWGKGQGNPDLILLWLGRVLGDRIARFSVGEGPERRQCT